MRKKILLMGLCVFALAVQASDSINENVANLISASQTGSKAVYFPIEADKQFDLYMDFHNADEFNVRGALPNFFKKCKDGKDITIAYIGGSITRSENQYRNQSANYIAKMFPNVKMYGINAGIGGTGADLGACRFKDHVLKYSPDLVFVEFAVNGSDENGVEGIVRQIIKNNPKTDICLIYTIYTGQSNIYGEGKIPFNIERLDKVAKHYDLPSIHMGMQAGILEAQDKLLWKAPRNYKGEKIKFSYDGVHPAIDGGNMYAGAIARAFEAMKNNTTPRELDLKYPLSARQMENATMVNPQDLGAVRSGWKKLICKDDENFRQFKDWFEDVYVANAKTKALKFKFKGDRFGFLDIGAPDSCQIDVYIDDKKIVPLKYNHNGKIIKVDFVDKKDSRASISRFTKHCVRYRGQEHIFEVEDGVHTVMIKVNPQKIDKAKISELSPQDFEKKQADFEPQNFYLGRILINGELIK